MATVKLEILTDKTNTGFYHTMTQFNKLADNTPRDVPSDWRNDPYYVSGTNYNAVNIVSGVWRTAVDRTYTLVAGMRLGIGFDTQGISGHTYVTMKLTINGVVKKTITFGSELKNISIYTVSGYDEDGTPTYLETLDKLDQWSSAQYVPNSGNRLNL